MRSLAAEWLRPEGMTAEDIRRWSALAAGAAEPNPFFEPEILLPAARALNSARLRLLVIKDGGGWVGLLPLRSVLRWHRLPWPALATWSHDYCFLGTPLIAAGHEREVAAELLVTARDRSSGCLALENVPAEGPVGDAIAAVVDELLPPPVVWNSWERAALQRRPEAGYVQLRSRRRRELRRLRGQLEGVLGAPLTTIDRANDPSAVDDFLALEAAGWKGRAGGALAAARAAGFFRETCDALRAQGRLQLLSLQAGDRVVAMKCNFLAAGTGFCFKIAYDEEFARWSPGVQLELDNVEVFHHGTVLDSMDSCADPDNEMINRLWPDRRRLLTLLVPTSGPGGRLTREGAGVAVRLRRRTKETQ
jgi:CelD/BcsL family acetyltransferase involved in cellulose biosynthesis